MASFVKSSAGRVSIAHLWWERQKFFLYWLNPMKAVGPKLESHVEVSLRILDSSQQKGTRLWLFD
jgi:hypothetical protein